MIYNLKNKQNVNLCQNTILSAAEPKNSILNLNNNKQLTSTILKQKMMINIYYDDYGKTYIEHSTAYALGLINTRAIITEQSKLIELSSSQYSKIVNNDFKY